MCKLIKSIFLSFLLLNLAVASERTDNLLSHDSAAELDQLHRDRLELSNHKEELAKIRNKIKRTRKGQNVYLEFKKIGGSILIVGIIIGSYKVHFPQEFRVMLGAFVTVEGLSRGLIKLNDKDMNKIIVDIRRFNIIALTHEKQLKKKIRYYCNIEPGHYACYAN